MRFLFILVTIVLGLGGIVLGGLVAAGGVPVVGIIIVVVGLILLVGGIATARS